MSTTSNLELNAANSQVSGSMDSLSLPSEPPDIRNWFASFVYESPELNTLDGFQDSDKSVESFPERETVASLSKSRIVNRQDCDFVAGDGPDALEHSQSIAAVPGLSESFSLLSEPPDIRNWFSSYLYESPALDTLDNSAISHYKEAKDGKIDDAQKNCTEKKAVTDCTDISQNTVLPCYSRISAFIDTKQDNQSVFKDNFQINPSKSRLSTQSHSTPKTVSEHTYHNHGSVYEKFGRADRDGKNTDHENISPSRLNDMSHKLLNIENKTDIPDEKSLDKLNASFKHNLEKEASPRTLEDSTPIKGNYSRRIGKENELVEDGFISTRKKSGQADTRSLRTPLRVPFDSVRNGVKQASNCVKDANISRKVLSETTNFRSPKTVEITGKWYCPQKNKPNLGPPLKQLRLEQWLRRA